MLTSDCRSPRCSAPAPLRALRRDLLYAHESMIRPASRGPDRAGLVPDPGRERRHCLDDGVLRGSRSSRYAVPASASTMRCSHTFPRHNAPTSTSSEQSRSTSMRRPGRRRDFGGPGYRLRAAGCRFDRDDVQLRAGRCGRACSVPRNRGPTRCEPRAQSRARGTPRVARGSAADTDHADHRRELPQLLTPGRADVAPPALASIVACNQVGLAGGYRLCPSARGRSTVTVSPPSGLASA